MERNRFERERQVLLGHLGANLFRFFNVDSSDTYVVMGARTNSGNVYTLRVELDDFPFDIPPVYVTQMLTDIDGNPLDEVSAEMHVLTPKNGWTSVYAYDAEAFTTEVLRNLCQKAGVHFYVEDLWPVFANERLLTIHCKDGGERMVQLPRKVSQVVDLFTGEVVAKKAKSFKVNFASPDVRLYELIP